MRKLPKRIHLIGPPGSGKTYLAKRLTKELSLPHYELDDIFWKKKYAEIVFLKEGKKKLKPITLKKRRIIGGVFSSWVEDSIKRAELIIWIDPPAYTIIRRVIQRFLKRRITRAKHQESFKDLITLIKYTKKYRHEGYFEDEELIKKHKVDFVYIRNKKELNQFLQDFLKRKK